MPNPYKPNPYKQGLQGAAAALAVAFALAGTSVHAQDAAGSSAPAAEASVPPSVDTDKDGKPDANGVADAWDTNGDGKPDTFDDDGDGKPDAKKPAR